MSAVAKTVHRDPAAGAHTREGDNQRRVEALLVTSDGFREWLSKWPWADLGMTGRTGLSPLSLFIREKAPGIERVLVRGKDMECFVFRPDWPRPETDDGPACFVVELPPWAFLFQRTLENKFEGSPVLMHYPVVKLRGILDLVDMTLLPDPT